MVEESESRVEKVESSNRKIRCGDGRNEDKERLRKIQRRKKEEREREIKIKKYNDKGAKIIGKVTQRNGNKDTFKKM